MAESAGQPVKVRFETIWKKFHRRFFRLICYTMPIYVLIFVAQEAGFFNWLREATASAVSMTFLPVESASVVIFSVATEFSSGIAAAGALLSSGALTVHQTVAALILGSIVATPVRALRHQLPTHAGIFSPKLGTAIVIDQSGAADLQPDYGHHPLLVVVLSQMNSPVRHRSLRTGFSTGTAAAGAVTAALLALAEKEAPASLEVPLPGGGSLLVPVHGQALLGSTGEGRIIKNAGDDPDVTHGALIGAKVRLLNGAAPAGEVIFRRGEGVGLVTKPGLPVPPGEPAINPVPRKIIRQVARHWWPQLFPGRPLRLEVEIFAPQGEELARQTLNPRLGILGGISILGTTGLVKPFSHQAYRATIALGLKVARAAGLSQVICSTGGKSEVLAGTLLPGLPEEALVQMGDYVHFAIRLAGRLGFRKITVAAFFGKAMKIAQGLGHTHASQGRGRPGPVSPMDQGPHRQPRPGRGYNPGQHGSRRPGAAPGGRGAGGGGPGRGGDASDLENLCRSAGGPGGADILLCGSAFVAGGD